MKTIKEKPTPKTQQPAPASKTATKKADSPLKDRNTEAENEDEKTLPVKNSNVNTPSRLHKSNVHESILDDEDEMDDVKEIGEEDEETEVEINDLDDDLFDEEEEEEDDYEEEDVDEEDDEADHGRSYKRK